ncbi:MAG: BrnT family toxin [Thiotrichales bacterium]|nr:BrnT family toxin [Thiotrichales bacterium]
MLDFTRTIGFQWDQGNARKSTDKHGVSQTEAEQMFGNESLVVVEDDGHSQSEQRFHALGVSVAGRRLHVTFTLRAKGTLIRVISARDMSRKERIIHDQET